MPRDLPAIPPIAADRRVVYGDDPSHFFDVFRAAGEARGVVVFIHGGFWRAQYDLTHASHLCAALARAGISTASLEYRRVGNDGGWAMSFDDVRAALAVVRADLDAVPVVLGHSAGGHLALRLAPEKVELAGIVALAPVADLRLAYDLHLGDDAVVEFLGGTPAEKPHVYAAADASHHSASVPRILIHGADDDVVPIALSRAFLKARAGDPGRVELIELPATDHYHLIDPGSAAWPVVLDGVGRLLSG
jgi:acetyl esterase/lipase